MLCEKKFSVQVASGLGGVSVVLVRAGGRRRPGWPRDDRPNCWGGRPLLQEKGV